METQSKSLLEHEDFIGVIVVVGESTHQNLLLTLRGISFLIPGIFNVVSYEFINVCHNISNPFVPWKKWANESEKTERGGEKKI